MRRAQRIQAFVVLLACGLALMGLALFVFLPLILFAPSKFALSFTMGSICFMAAFAAFRGPRTFCKGLLERERIGFTAAYSLSIGAFVLIDTGIIRLGKVYDLLV